MQFQPKAPTQPQSQTAPFPQGWKPQGGPPSPVGWPPPPTPQTVGAKAQPLVRAKNLNPESTPTAGQQPVTLSLPSPAALGIAPAAQLPGTTVELVDWNAARARLNQLGAVSFNVNRLVSGAYRMVVTLPTANPSQNYLVEVVAESEAVAVATALDRAESWARK